MREFPGLQVRRVELHFPDQPYSQQTVSQSGVEGMQRLGSESWSIKGADKLAGHVRGCLSLGWTQT